MVQEFLPLLLHEALLLPYACHYLDQKLYEHLSNVHILPAPVFQILKLSNRSVVYPLYLSQLSATLFHPSCIEVHIQSYDHLLHLEFLEDNAKHQLLVLLLHHFPVLMSLFYVLAFHLHLLYSSLYANVFLLFRPEHILQDLHLLFQVYMHFLLLL